MENNDKGNTTQVLFQFGPINGDVQNQEIVMQDPGKKTEEKQPAETDQEKVSQLSNRQLVIFVTTIMDLTLDKEFMNQMALARLLSALSGRSVGSIRQTIMEIAKNGLETQEAKHDMLVVAELLKKISPSHASMLINDARS